MTNDRTVICLRSWTIKRQNGKFFIAPTGHFDGKHAWRRKSYASLQKATTAIARLLQAEWQDRDRWKAELQNGNGWKGAKK